MKLLSTLFPALALAVLLFGCEKNNDNPHSLSCDLPSTPVPSFLVGNWASGYSSSTDIVDAYSGQYVGNQFQSGKYFHFDADGKYAEFYYMANAGLTANSATKAIGTVEFLDDNSFIFHACRAHYKGWQNGVLTIDRDATESEVANPSTLR